MFRDGDRILVAPGFDRVKDERYYRPLGGAVEFGERAVDALRREIREEIGAEIVAPVRLGVLENLFTCDGRAGHEVVFVFDARLADARLYAEASLPLLEAGWIGPATWLDLEAPEDAPLYPDGLRALLVR